MKQFECVTIFVPALSIYWRRSDFWDRVPAGAGFASAGDYAEGIEARLDRGDDLFVLDVREPHEYQICNLQGHLIPLGELPRRVHELDSSREIVAYCRSGRRSAEAIDFLRKAGFRKIHNLKGGILAWSDEVDATVPKY